MSKLDVKKRNYQAPRIEILKLETEQFIATSTQNGNDFNQETGCTEGIQTCIDFKRVSNWGGFVNTSVFLIHFSDDNSVEKTIIK